MLTDKSPTLRGPTCQGVLGLVFHRFPGRSIRPHYMPIKRAECFPFWFFLEMNFFKLSLSLFLSLCFYESNLIFTGFHFSDFNANFQKLK